MTDAPVKPIPLLFRWNAEAGMMEPFNLSAARAQYVDQANYRLHPFEERSKKSHDHLFVIVQDAFDNLPEKYHGKISDPTHLRKWATIKAGFRTELVFPCASEREFEMIVRKVKKIDQYAVVVADEESGTVTAYFAESLSNAEMGKERFQKAKTGVLEVLAALLEVPVDELTKHGGQAA